MAEALALRRAVFLARDEHFTHVTFASDCFSLVQRINSNIRDRPNVGSVVMDIKQAALAFTSSTLKHVRRYCNLVAHILANSCKNSSLFSVSLCSGLYRKTLKCQRFFQKNGGT